MFNFMVPFYELAIERDGNLTLISITIVNQYNKQTSAQINDQKEKRLTIRNT